MVSSADPEGPVRPSADSREVAVRAYVESVRRCLAAATGAIHRDYYLLPMQDSGTAYRERTYCYELYHQMKAHWPSDLADAQYELGGEVDKAGHRWFAHQTLRNKKPDLLVHDPGDMEKNLVVIEVKAVTARRAQIRADLQKLTAFCGRGKYSRAFYLLYGYQGVRVDRILKMSATLAEGNRTINLSQIDFYWHAGPEQPAKLVGWGLTSEPRRRRQD